MALQVTLLRSVVTHTDVRDDGRAELDADRSRCQSQFTIHLCDWSHLQNECILKRVVSPTKYSLRPVLVPHGLRV